MTAAAVGQAAGPPPGESWADRIGTLEREVARLTREADKYRSLVDQAPDALVIVDASGRIAHANAMVTTLFGYAREELEGAMVEMLVPATMRDAHLAHRAGYVRSPRSRAMGDGKDLVASRKDGTVFPVEISLSPLQVGGEMLVMCAIRDVTERRREKELLRSLNATLDERVRERTAELEERTTDLERSNAELAQFAYVASHDLQEPLRMVASYVRLLERQYRGKLDDDADEFIGYAVEGATRMQQLIQDLLKVSRVESRGRPPSPVQASAALKTALDNLELTIREAGATVSIGTLPEVRADPTQLVQLFQNLVANAIKFRGELPPQVHVDAQRGDGAWCFSVRDNGIGIDEAFREQVFMMFRRLHPRERYPGTGIGLALCRKIVERHGGHIWVESNQGAGATFQFTIPDRSRGAK